MPSKSRKKVLYEKQNGKCFYCMEPTIISKFSVDHFVPKADGGKDTWSNLVGACVECNNKKGRKAVDAFKQEIPVIMANRDMRYLEKSFAKLDGVLPRMVSHLEYAYAIIFQK